MIAIVECRDNKARSVRLAPNREKAIDSVVEEAVRNGDVGGEITADDIRLLVDLHDYYEVGETTVCIVETTK